MNTTTICIKCLSRNRKLFSVKEIPCEVLNFCNINLKSMICWECKAITRKIMQFRRRAEMATAILTKVIKSNSRDAMLPILSGFDIVSVVKVEISKDYNENENILNTSNIKFEEVDQRNMVFIKDSTNICDEILNDNQFEENDLKAVKSEFKDSDSIDIEDVNITPEKDEVEVKLELFDEEITPVETSLSQNEEIKIFKVESIVSPHDMYEVVELTEDEMWKRWDQKSKERVKKNAFRCEKCLEFFYKQPFYEKHQQLHAMKTPFSCLVCHLNFNSQTEMDLHYTNHFKLYKCRICEVTYDSISRVLPHYHKNHLTKIRKCKTCGKEFSTQREFRNHVRARHAKQITCDICGKTFAASQRKLHMRLHTGIPRLECDICHKFYRGENGLYRHKRTAHGDKNDEAAYCTECDTQFSNVYIYAAHLKRSKNHNDPKEFKHECTHCGKRFAIKSHLKDHIQSIHIKEPNYLCENCPRKFTTRDRLRRHIVRAHEKIVAKRNKICDFCGKDFDNKNSLIQHINSHTGARPYCCNICQATFGYRSALYNHTKLKHKKVKRNNL